MKVHAKFRIPSPYLVFLTPAILIHERNDDAPSNFILGISIDWLWWQLAIAFEKTN